MGRKAFTPEQIFFERFKDGGFKEELDNQKIIKLLSRIKLPYITNAKQVEECKAELPIEFYESVQPGLIASATPEQTLEELAQTYFASSYPDRKT